MLHQQDTDGTEGWDMTQTRTHNAANEILSIDNATTPVVHNAVGNMTRVPQPENWANNSDLTYDAWNRLMSVASSDFGSSPMNTLLVQYRYDSLNRCVARQLRLAGQVREVRNYCYNQRWQCVEEYVSNSQVAQYLWGLRYIDDLIRTSLSGQWLNVLQDTNWNVVALTSGTTITERYTYTAFGKRQIYDASFTPRTTSSYPHFTRTFTGQVLDTETSLLLYRNRHYHPTLGRFIQRDPIGYSGGDRNLYRYIKNRIVLRNDIYGLCCTENCSNQEEIPEWARMPPLSSLPGIVEAMHPEEPQARCGLDVENSLKNFNDKVKTEINKNAKDDNEKLCKACRSLLSFPQGLWAWDIYVFHDAGDKKKEGLNNTFTDKGCGSLGCEGSVSINGHCYWAAEVNYYLYGLALRLCAEKLHPGDENAVQYWVSEGKKLVMEYRSGFYPSRLLEHLTGHVPPRRSPGVGIPGRIAWVDAGAQEDFSKADDANIDERCPAKCPYVFTGVLTGHIGGESISF